MEILATSLGWAMFLRAGVSVRIGENAFSIRSDVVWELGKMLLGLGQMDSQAGPEHMVCRSNWP